MNADDALERLSTLYARQLLPAQAVAEAMSVYLEMGERIAELDAIRASARQVVADVLAEIGAERLETPAGLCYVSKPGIRTSYDAHGLDQLAAERPDLAGLLAPYRSEKPVAGALTIRAHGKKGP